jgi:outer membrane protein TolC
MFNKTLISIVAIHGLLFSYTIDFDNAIKLAVNNNKELKAKKLDIEKSKQDVKEAHSYTLGKVELNENIANTNNAGYAFGMKLSQRQASFADFGFDQFLAQMPNLLNPADTGAGSRVLATEPSKLNHPDAVTNIESKVVYEVPLFTGGKLDSAKEMANLQVKANEYKYARDEKVLGLDVLKAYNGAVVAKNFIKITEDSKKLAYGFIKKSKKLYNDGLIRQFEVKQAQVAYKSIDIKLKEARNNFDLAIAYLQFLTNDKGITDVGDMKTFSTNFGPLERAQEDAISKRDDYSYMDYNVKTMKEKIKFDSADKLPVVGAHLEFGFNDDKLNTDMSKDYYLAAVGLKYTIFDGDLTSIKRQKAMVDYQKVQNYQSYMKDGIALEVKQHYDNLKTADNTLKEKREVAYAAKKVLREIEDVYDDNLQFRTNMMYLLMQLENVVKSQADVAMSQYNRSIDEGKLKLAIGESLMN